MYYVTGKLNGGGIRWSGGEDYPYEDKGVVVSFSVPSPESPQRYWVSKIVKEAVEENKIPWIAYEAKGWRLNLRVLKETFDWLLPLEWLVGKIQMKPEFEIKPTNIWFGANYQGTTYEGTLAFYLTPEMLTEANVINVPLEIQESLKSFKKDFPDSSKVAFVMMDFSKTDPHRKIKSVIEESLRDHMIIGVRSDYKTYHDDLFPNVKTYIYGCDFGVAVFERIMGDKFNPNVALEVGYMMALGKPVCLLKDKTIDVLPADLIEKLYKPFDVHDPESTIPPQITKWLEDKGIIR